MEMIYVLLSILQTISISLGVGCSTVAITSFFVAIADGVISPEERKLLGVTYILLRVAMVAIFITTFLLAVIQISTDSSIYFNPFSISRWILIIALFTNALLMTKHIIPATFGPAIQASTWYTLGITLALVPLGQTSFSLFEFVFGYLAAITLAVAIVNGIMTHLKSKKG